MNIKILAVIITTAVVTGVVFLAASRYLDGRQESPLVEETERPAQVRTTETEEQVPTLAIQEKTENAPAPKAIYLLYPTGNEVWQPGGAYEIRWQPQNISGAYHIYAFHRDPTNIDKKGDPTIVAYPGIIASVDVTKRSFIWNIPPQLKQGFYKIRISNDPYEDSMPLSNQPREIIAAESGLIAIKELNVKPPKLSFTYPTSGDRFTQGSELQLRWQGGGEKISIELIHKGLFDTVGASVAKSWSLEGIANTGAYNLTIPSYLSGNFFVEISDNTWQTARSGVFSIMAKPQTSVAPKIDVVTPVTNQKLRRGDIQLIQWISVNVSKVTVEVLRKTGSGLVAQSFGEFISDASMPWTPGLISWMIPKNFEEGDYVVRITDWQHGIQAESGKFTIAGNAY